MPLTNGSTPVLVNTTTAEAQGFSTVADLPGIGYVVIWQGPGYNPSFPAETGLYGQCYSYSGAKIGNEFLVSNNFVTGFKADADVVGGPGGTFTVTWSSFDSSSLGIYMKSFNLGGSPASQEVQVNTVTGGSEELSQVVRLSNGNIAVVWQGTGSNPGETGVFARYYDSSLQPLGGQFQVNTSPTGLGAAPSLTAGFGAGCVAVWQGAATAEGSDVYLQLIDHTGAKVGSEILVNLPGQGAERNPVVTTLLNGSYVVAWDVAQPGGAATEIYAQRFGLNGEKLGGQIHVTAGDFTGSRPAIAATAEGGGFAITFQSNFQTMVRTFDEIGNPGDPWPIAEDVPILQSRPDIALLGDGSFIVSFHNGDIFTERFRTTDYLTEGDDRAMGTGFSDYIEGFGGDDILRGGDGDDLLEGGLGADRMIGGAGRDEVTYANALSGVSLNLLSGGHGGEAQGDSFEGIEQFSLSRNADRFIGGDGDDNVYGMAGDDSLAGGNGNNLLDGGDGNDLLEGGAGTDLLNGGDGFDEVSYVRANFGLSIDLVSNRGAGAALFDSYFSIEKFTLSRFSDEFFGTDVLDRVAGGSGDDWIFGRGGNDLLDGNNGNDMLDGGSGADQLNGGAGDDTYIVDTVADLAIEGPGGGNDLVRTLTDYTLGFGLEVEGLAAFDKTQTSALNLIGNRIANVLEGNAGANMLNGLGGADTMRGFAGNDIYYVDDSSDIVVELAGEGGDIVYARGSYSLATGVSVETLSSDDIGGTAAVTLNGNEFANMIYGNYGANVLNGGGGADYLRGFGGNDSYYVDDAGDVVFETANEGGDIVYATTSYALAAGSSVEVLSTDSFGGVGAINLTGNELANTLYGNSGANVLNGGGGSDYLLGVGGADTFAFTTAPGAGNVDTVADFVAGIDKLALDDAVFTAIGGLGALNANAFVTGAAAADASDRIVYNSATGQLFYDADGNGGGGAVLFATLNGAPTLAASDFLVI